MSVRLELLKSEFEEEFIKMNQFAFKYGAEQYFNESEMEEQYEEEGEIISRENIYLYIPFIIKDRLRIVFLMKTNRLEESSLTSMAVRVV